MKIKLLVTAAAAATALIAGAAQATVTTVPASVTGQSFADALLGTGPVTAAPDTLGSVFAADNIAFPSPFSGNFSQQTVAFTSGSAGALADGDSSGAAFSLRNAATGDRPRKTSGTLSGPAASAGSDVIRETAEESAVPEPKPETYAMMLAGLVAVGFMSARRIQG